MEDQLLNKIKGWTITERGLRPHIGDYKKTQVQELGVILFPTAISHSIIVAHAPFVLEIEDEIVNSQSSNSK